MASGDLIFMSIVERYSRQVLFEGIGKEGQQQLLQSRVVVIGCGALGAMQLEMLARAGVGHLRAIDRDFVEMTNLHRQIMFSEADAQQHLPKAVAAQNRIKQINNEIEVEAIVADVNYTNIEKFIADADLVLDGTDNFETRFLINDACAKLEKPWIYGAAVAANGLTMVILPGKTACLRCVFENAPPPGSTPTCDTAGVVLPIIAIIAAWQIAEALKILTKQWHKLHGGLLQIDIWQGTHKKINLGGLRDRSECPCCQKGQYDFLAAKERSLITTMCGRNSIQIVPGNAARIDLAALAERLKAGSEVHLNKFLLRFKVEDFELTVFADARSIIHGTKDERVARALYARYIGV